MGRRRFLLVVSSLVALVLVASAFLVFDVGVKDREFLLKEKLDLTSEAHLDYENVAHLVFLNKYATEKEKEFSARSVSLGKKLMAEQGYAFNRVQYEEAILAYPTPEIVLDFANGFLRTAQTNTNVNQPNLNKVLGNNNVAWYLEGAKFYFQLAVEFSAKIDNPFESARIVHINAAIDCIDASLQNTTHNTMGRCSYVD